MTLKKKIIIGVIALILVAIAAYFFLKKKPAALVPAAPKVDPNNGAMSGTINGQIPGTVTNDNFPLQIGSVGHNVEVLQAALNKLSGSNLTIDGVFGSKTKDKVMAAGPNLYPVQKDDFDLIMLYSNSI